MTFDKYLYVILKNIFFQIFLPGLRRKCTALALCKSIKYAIQWFQIHHLITFATIQNPAVCLSGAGDRMFPSLVHQPLSITISLMMTTFMTEAEFTRGT